MEAAPLQTHLLNTLRDRPDARALGVFHDDRTCDWQTYREFYTNVDRRMRALRAHGVSAGDACLLVLPSTRFTAEAVIATYLLGAHPLLIAPPFLMGENPILLRVVEHCVGKLTPKLILCDESATKYRGDFEGFRDGVTAICGEAEFQAVAEEPGDPLSIEAATPGIDDTVGFQLTSGTTALPKICHWKHRHLMAALDGMVGAMALDPETDRFCNWTPYYHDMGLVNNLLLCLTTGVPLVHLEPHQFVKRPAIWLQTLSDTRCTTTWSPNFGYALAATRTKEADLEGLDLSCVRGFWNAAERIHAETFERFFDRFQNYGVERSALKTNFGCAEVIGGITFTEPDRSFPVEHCDGDRLFDEGVAKTIDAEDGNAVPVVGCGKPAPGVLLEILDDDDTVLDAGHVGRLRVSSESRFSGYVDHPEATAKALHGESVITGDLAYLRDGELFWVGRTDERLNLLGRKLDPSDFEPILNTVPGLRPGCFIAFAHVDPGTGTAGVVLMCETTWKTADEANAADDPTPRSILGAVRKRVTQQLRVGIHDVLLMTRGSLPKTSSGKRRHLHFKRQYESEGPSAFQTTLIQPSG